MQSENSNPLLAPPHGQVLSVNVGQVREIEWLGQTWTTAIWKLPVQGPVALRGVNLAGDDQADRVAHGGMDKAVYSYAREDAAWWEQQLGRSVEAGAFGENLTLAGIAVTDAVVGERWEIGTALLEVSQPRVPCFKLGARMGDAHFPQRFAAAGRPGAYLRIVREGEVTVGDALRVVSRPAHGVTVGEIAHVYHRDRAHAEQLLAVPELSRGWHTWAKRVIAAQRRRTRHQGE